MLNNQGLNVDGLIVVTRTRCDRPQPTRRSQTAARKDPDKFSRSVTKLVIKSIFESQSISEARTRRGSSVCKNCVYKL